MNQVTAPAPAVTACPQCQQPLCDPKGIGWCKACGYCRSVAESGKKVAATPTPKPAVPSTVSVTRSAILHTPTWLIVTVVGAVAIVVALLAIGRFMPMTALQRAVITSSVIVGGVFVMFVGQFIGLLKTAPTEATLSFKDAIFPFHLYGLVLKRMPEAQFTVYLGAWGMTAAVTVAIVIGGLGHWFTYLPKSDKNQPKNQPQKTTNDKK